GTYPNVQRVVGRVTHDPVINVKTREHAVMCAPVEETAARSSVVEGLVSCIGGYVVGCLAEAVGHLASHGDDVVVYTMASQGAKRICGGDNHFSTFRRSQINARNLSATAD